MHLSIYKEAQNLGITLISLIFSCQTSIVSVFSSSQFGAGFSGSPDATIKLYEDGEPHLNDARQNVILKNVLLSFAGLFSIIPSDSIPCLQAGSLAQALRN